MLNKYVWIASLVHCLFFSHVFSQECPPMIGSYHQMRRPVVTVNNNLNHSLIMMFTAPALKWYIISRENRSNPNPNPNPNP